MRKYLYGLLLTGFVSTGIISCSNNYDDYFEPLATVRSLDVNVESPLFSNGKLSLGAGPASVVVEVKSNTRWAAEVSDCDGGWCDIDAFNGAADGSFTISVRENLKENRTCYIKVYKVDAEGNKELADSKEITVSQVSSDVRLYPSSVEPFPADPTNTPEFEIISNVSWKLNVSYEASGSTEFVSITPIGEGMSKISDNSYEGNGDAKFRVSLLSNRTAANRSAFLNLTSEVGNYTVELSQLKSEYTFDVSPVENQIIPATGGEVEFRVLALCGWTITSASDWIQFSNTGGSGNLQIAESVKATVDCNTDGYQRTGVVRLTPTEEQYKDMATSVTIIQRGYDLTFALSPTETGVLLAERQTKEFEIDSRFDWEVVSPDWMTVAPSQGTASISSQIVKVEIAENSRGDSRTGTITFYPKSTLFDGGANLDPSVLGIEPLKINLTQFGGQEPAISVPWLADGYTQTRAIVEFNFYSPFYPITEAGIEWKRADSEDWNDLRVTLESTIDGKVSVELTGLNPATEYVARGYVVYNDGEIKYGVTSVPFTTAGKRPGAEDNPTPSR